METFKGAEVAPIDEMLERTHYVRALREDIANLSGERDALAAQLEWRGAQFSVVIHERDDALTKLAEAQAEIDRLTNVGLEVAYGEATKADELEHWIATCDRLTAERDHLRRQLEVFVDANAALHATLSAQHALLVEVQAGECQTCGGIGYTVTGGTDHTPEGIKDDPCPVCNGDGVVNLRRKLAEAQAEIEWKDKARLALIDAYAKVIHQCNEAEMERDDLAGKLAAAHQELHDLRIRAGMGEKEAD